MNKIYQFFNERWAIGTDKYRRMAVVLLQAIKSGQIEAASRLLDSNPVRAYAADPYLAARYELSDTDIPSGSVGVITLEGPLFSWETLRLEQYIDAAMRNDRIVGVVLWINGPGGMISRVDIVAEKIANAPKPVAAYVAGVMASAHFWIGSAAGRTFVASPMGEVGSVGVMVTYQSLKGFYQQNGIDFREIYPDTADLKNKWFRDIEEQGDETIIKQRLADDHLFMSQAVARYLNVKYDPQLPLFRGATFTGEEAVAAGYIDQIGTLEDAARWVLAQDTVKKISTQH